MRKEGSPYRGMPSAKWADITRSLVRAHPLETAEIVEVVTKVWADIFDSAIGSKPFRIGVDIHPKPQIMAFFLHELIPAELAFRHPDLWRGEQSATDKDLVYIPNPEFSVEIKPPPIPALFLAIGAMLIPARKRRRAKMVTIWPSIFKSSTN